ncbi:uncharacterized protein LOC114649283 isoform X6 [Erpetoichthys calabaricus]|nr:uncharacterized protein LOC114649283 isoform X6 [Erpetoichthys calabaricus]
MALFSSNTTLQSSSPVINVSSAMSAATSPSLTSPSRLVTSVSTNTTLATVDNTAFSSLSAFSVTPASTISETAIATNTSVFPSSSADAATLANKISSPSSSSHPATAANTTLSSSSTKGTFFTAFPNTTVAIPVLPSSSMTTDTSSATILISSAQPGQYIVQNLSAVVLNATAVFLYWDAPIGNAIRYNVVQSNSGNSSSKFVQERFLTINGLLPLSTHTIQVSAIAKDGTQGDPVSITVTTSGVSLHYEISVGSFVALDEQTRSMILAMITNNLQKLFSWNEFTISLT